MAADIVGNALPHRLGNRVVIVPVDTKVNSTASVLSHRFGQTVETANYLIEFVAAEQETDLIRPVKIRDRCK